MFSLVQARQRGLMTRRKSEAEAFCKWLGLDRLPLEMGEPVETPVFCKELGNEFAMQGLHGC